MVFNSHLYLFFLTIAVTTFWLLPARYRVYSLGVFSLVFYSFWRVDFVFLLIFSALVDFIASKKIHASTDPGKRKLFLAVSLCLNLGLLVFFKYTDFIYTNIAALASIAGVNLPVPDSFGLNHIILPLGISFYTFQTISYSIDIYRNVAKPINNFFVFLTYVSFWPQLVAGPILRVQEVVPQLENPQKTTISDFGYGISRILTGLFKKIVIADYISGIVDSIFMATHGSYVYYTAYDVWLGAFLFGFQIYFDFAGYSDIALGSARLVGVRFPENFHWPYMAKSPKDFWRRWHISLSSWIRDYLYLPLTGQKFQTRSTEGMAVSLSPDRSKSKTTLALFFTWAIMGLWHGSAWTFVFWGVYHAAVVYTFRKIKFLRNLHLNHPVFSWLVTLFVSMAGWISFRAQSLEQTIVMMGKLINPLAYNPLQIKIYIYHYPICLFLLMGMILMYLLRNKFYSKQFSTTVRSTILVGATALMTVLVFANMRTINQFIYFQF